MAGSAMILPELRWMWQGIEAADSLVMNPHKWFGAAFDCSLYYVRDPLHLVRVMSTNPSYLQTAQDAQVKTCATGAFRSDAGSALSSCGV
jgi:aromatic-L-amino-acid decarboxylase